VSATGRPRSRLAGARLPARPALLVLAGLALLLGACSRPALRTPDAAAMERQLAREGQLEALRDWGFDGRIAVSGPGDGGSGRIEWRRQGDRLEVSVSAPVSRQSWRLQSGPEGARLEGLEGGTREADDAEALLRDSVGWDLPLAAVEAWIRGARSQGSLRIGFGAEGLPDRLEEAGWQIEYRGWGRGEPPLPQRVFARSGERSLRLVVDRWHVPDADG
jgi:outer membrane lipoprotein LolB